MTFWTLTIQDTLQPSLATFRTAAGPAPRETTLAKQRAATRLRRFFSRFSKPNGPQAFWPMAAWTFNPRSIPEAISKGIRLLASYEKLRLGIQVGIDQTDRGELFHHDIVFAQLK